MAIACSLLQILVYDWGSGLGDAEREGQIPTYQSFLLKRDLVTKLLDIIFLFSSCQCKHVCSKRLDRMTWSFSYLFFLWTNGSQTQKLLGQQSSYFPGLGSMGD